MKSYYDDFRITYSEIFQNNKSWKFWSMHDFEILVFLYGCHQQS